MRISDKELDQTESEKTPANEALILDYMVALAWNISEWIMRSSAEPMLYNYHYITKFPN